MVYPEMYPLVYLRGKCYCPSWLATVFRSPRLATGRAAAGVASHSSLFWSVMPKRTNWESVRLNLPKGTKAKAKKLAKRKGHLVWMREVILHSLVSGRPR